MINKKLAIYLRLSMEDRIKNDSPDIVCRESESIAGQRKILLKYIREDDLLKDFAVAEFCDDGFTGTNLNRPGMQKMLECVRKKEIQCILVKDLSRFSRNYKDLGEYLNLIFPIMGIRFISVNDHYDSEDYVNQISPLDTAFRSLIYDFYCKDISVKVKASLESACRDGDYIFGQVPFGYRKSEEDRHKVVINENEAELVRFIFFMAEQGMSNIQIARKLNDEHIPTVGTIRLMQRGKRISGMQKWSDTVIGEILKNRFYLGEMAYKKAGYVHINHHEPLVTTELFDAVEALQRMRLPIDSQTPVYEEKSKMDRKHLLAGKIFCGGCGYAIRYKCKDKNCKKKNYYACRHYPVAQTPDCCTYFRADAMEQMIKEELKVILLLCENREKQSDVWKQFFENRKKTMYENIVEMERKCGRLRDEKVRLYEKFKNGEMTEFYFLSQMQGLSAQLDMVKEQIEYKRNCIDKEFNEERQKITFELSAFLIKKMIVYKEKKVEIEWNFTVE